MWRPLEDYPGYEVSEDGRVRSWKYKGCRERKLFTTQKGYVQVQVSKNGKIKTLYVHRLVAGAFLINQGNLPEVNHIDGNKKNNHKNNLEWVTKKQNEIHSRSILGNGRGERHPSVILTEKDVISIRNTEGKLKNIAKRFGLSVGYVCLLRQRKRWSHVISS